MPEVHGTLVRLNAGIMLVRNRYGIPDRETACYNHAVRTAQRLQVGFRRLGIEMINSHCCPK
jgi:hypothetical protein